MNSLRSQPCDGSKQQGKSLVIIGLGNIGSHLALLAGRLPAVGRLALIDFDRYERRNVNSQDMDDGDRDLPKAQAQARRLHRMRPSLNVESFVARVEDLPLGRLRGDVILAGLDSRAARQYVNQAAWRLGIPWIDGAVDASGLLARVAVFSPSPECPCLECAWDEADYAAIEQRYPCQGNDSHPATHAPAALGAVVAGIMALECQKLVDGDRQHVLVGRQVFCDLRHHTYDVTRGRRHPQCRFDHQSWPIERLPAEPVALTVGQFLELASPQGRPQARWTLDVDGRPFTRCLYCPTCRKLSEIPVCLVHRIPAVLRACPDCAKPMVVRGFDLRHGLDVENLLPSERELPLFGLGIESGEVLTMKGPNGEALHFELGRQDLPFAGNGEDQGDIDKPAASARGLCT